MKNINHEIQAQQTWWSNFRIGAILYAIVPFLAGYNGHPYVCLFLLIAGIIGFWLWAEVVLAEFEYRKEAIKYKQQVENLYICSTWPGDDTVGAVFLETLNKLVEHKNPHEVRVYQLIYGRPVIRVTFINKEGKRIDQQIPRLGIVAGESWEEFCSFSETFRTEQTDKRRRELEASPAWEWNEQFVYHQNFN